MESLENSKYIGEIWQFVSKNWLLNFHFFYLFIFEVLLCSYDEPGVDDPPASASPGIADMCNGVEVRASL